MNVVVTQSAQTLVALLAAHGAESVRNGRLGTKADIERVRKDMADQTFDANPGVDRATLNDALVANKDYSDLYLLEGLAPVGPSEPVETVVVATTAAAEALASAAERVRKDRPGLTAEQAVAAALLADPSLYDDLASDQ